MIQMDQRLDVFSMVLQAKETFWWSGLKEDIVQMRAKCLMCHQNTPSQPKEPSMAVPITNYAFKSLSVDHLKKKRIQYLAIVNCPSLMLSVHSTNF